MSNQLFEKFPRDTSKYDFSQHFRDDVLNDKDRYLDWKKALSAIKHGAIEEADGNADIEWVRDYHGVKVYILAGWNEKTETPVVITGWPGVHDPRQAIESGRWTERQLRDIHQFNDGNSLEADFCFP